MSQFNENVSNMIMDQFGRELPELYIPVVNKLLFRYYYLWLNASNAELSEQRSQNQKLPRNQRAVDRPMVFNKNRLLDNAWKLVKKFKSKCLPDIIMFKKQSTEEPSFIQNNSATTSTKKFHMHGDVCQRRAD